MHRKLPSLIWLCNWWICLPGKLQQPWALQLVHFFAINQLLPTSPQLLLCWCQQVSGLPQWSRRMCSRRASLLHWRRVQGKYDSFFCLKFKRGMSPGLQEHFWLQMVHLSLCQISRVSMHLVPWLYSFGWNMWNLCKWRTKV